MAPDLIHTAIVILIVGTLIRIAEYLLAQNHPDSLFYKYLVFAY